SAPAAPTAAGTLNRGLLNAGIVPTGGVCGVATIGEGALTHSVGAIVFRRVASDGQAFTRFADVVPANGGCWRAAGGVAHCSDHFCAITGPFVSTAIWRHRANPSDAT